MPEHGRKRVRWLGSVYRVPCPKCGARIGERCTSGRPHRERKLAIGMGVKPWGGARQVPKGRKQSISRASKNFSAGEYMMVYEISSDHSASPTRYRKLSSAKKAAQRDANRTGRAVTVYGFSGSSYTSGDPSEAISEQVVYPSRHANPISKSLTFRNMASVTVKRNPDGSVSVSGRRLAKKNPSMGQRWSALKAARKTAHPVRQAIRALKPRARLNPRRKR
jgi:hypothetical protein